MLKLAVVIAVLAVVSARYYDYRDEDYNVPRRLLNLGGRWFRNLQVDTVNDMYRRRYYDPYSHDGRYDSYRRGYDGYRGMSRSGYDGYGGLSRFNSDRYLGRDSYYPERRVTRRRRY